MRLIMVSSRSEMRIRGLQDTQSKKCGKTELDLQLHLKSEKDGRREDCQDEISQRVRCSLKVPDVLQSSQSFTQYASWTQAYCLCSRIPAFTRMALWIPKTPDVATLCEDGDAGHQVDDKRFCNEKPQKPPPWLGVAKKPEHENAKRYSAKHRAQNTHWLSNKFHHRRHDSLVVTEIEEMPTPTPMMSEVDEENVRES